jgi:histidyl-tRNA synthetase
LGIDRIILALGEAGKAHLDAYVVSESGPVDALRAASALRSQGLRVDFDPDGRSVKAQFRAARRLEAPVILVWRGDDSLVDVQTEDERVELALEEVAGWLMNR